MITEQDLQEAIAECQGERNPNANTCIKLAAFYTIKNELFPTDNKTKSVDYSFAPPPTETPLDTSGTIGDYGESDFLQAVKGKDPAEVWAVMDELMETLLLVNHRVYDGVMRKIRG